MISRWFLIIMMLGEGWIEGSRDGNVFGHLRLVLTGQKLMMYSRHCVGRCHTGRGLHLWTPTVQATLAGQKLGISSLALGDGIEPVGARRLLRVQLLLLLLL